MADDGERWREEQHRALALSESSRKILYWRDDYRPEWFANRPNPRASQAIAILRKYEVEVSWRGSARCRICSPEGKRGIQPDLVLLGYRDFIAHGFCWPEGAEHYIEAHGLWIPELDELIDAANGGGSHV